MTSSTLQIPAGDLGAVSEAALQTWLEGELNRNGWLWWHDATISPRKRRGYPDHHAAKDCLGADGMTRSWHLVVELKRETGACTEAQVQWLRAWQQLARTIGEATGQLWVSVYVWRPRDFARFSALLRQREPPRYSLALGAGVELDIGAHRRHQAPVGTRRRRSRAGGHRDGYDEGYDRFGSAQGIKGIAPRPPR